MAAILSEAVGKGIRVASTDDESMVVFEDHYKGILSTTFGRDMRLIYEQFREKEFGMTEDQYKVQVEFLGKQPEQYEVFVLETGKKWNKERRKE